MKHPSSLDLSWCQACPANTSHMFRGVILACTDQIVCISHITFPDKHYPVKRMSGKTGSINLLYRYVCIKQTLWLLWNNELLFCLLVVINIYLIVYLCQGNVSHNDIGNIELRKFTFPQCRSTFGIVLLLYYSSEEVVWREEMLKYTAKV